MPELGGQIGIVFLYQGWMWSQLLLQISEEFYASVRAQLCLAGLLLICIAPEDVCMLHFPPAVLLGTF